jgi:hypothetical protein
VYRGLPGRVAGPEQIHAFSFDVFGPQKCLTCVKSFASRQIAVDQIGSKMMKANFVIGWSSASVN